jgi:glycine oxidase
MQTTDVVVIGGGAIGTSIAWRAALSGLRVSLVERELGRGASWAAAGMLAPITEVHYGEEEVQVLGAESLARYPAFVAELESATGRDVGYRESGTLIVARDADDHAVLGELRGFQDRLGLKVDTLKRKEARELEPGLTPRLRAAWFVEGDHHVDNRALSDALHEAAKRAGVEMIADSVVSVDVAGERVTGVRLESGGSVGCDTVVLAAGCWSASIDGIPDRFRPPVRPVKGQLLYLRGPADPALIRHNVRGREVYLVPRTDGRVVVGATVEERGFDVTVTAGAVHELIRDAFDIVPGIAELELIECVAGLRPGSPDNRPIIGPSGLDGLVVATGHYRNGILLMPLTAEAITELLTSGSAPELIAAASPLRFRGAA